MIPFLKQVADHYFGKLGSGISDLCFVFPSRRAQVFFLKYLASSVKESGIPLQAPVVTTIDDFFYRTAKAGRTPRLRLLLTLYDCYASLFREKNGIEPESLDEFIHWGDVILKDFNDVDKYMVEPEKLFANVSDYKNLQDDFSYLTENQRKALTAFLGGFERKGDIKTAFLRVWDILLPLYRQFNEVLKSEGISYDGMVYRNLAETFRSRSATDILAESYPHCAGFVFVGLNALDTCEKTVLRRMKDAGLAQFCWDYSSEIISDRNNKSSLFLSDNILEFPQAFKPDPEGLPVPQVNVVSVASSIGQAKQLPYILHDLGKSAEDERTAVILPDEDLLISVLNSIPGEYANVNVSMGYSMKNSGIFALMGEVAALQMHIRYKDGCMFYHRTVKSIFSNAIFNSLLGEDDAAVVEEVKRTAKYYIPQEDLAGTPFLSGIFRPVVISPSDNSPEQIRDIIKYQKELILALVPLIKNNGNMALELDFAKQYYEALDSLQEYNLSVKPATYFRLLNQMVTLDSVPFKGEPLKGLQIMGPLETRAVDFENVIILSCNEGVFPRHPSGSSFIPAELRMGFGLPTYEYHDAMNAYYFYRLIQRAGTVWMLYDSRMKNMKAGEASRYLKQLEILYGGLVKVNHYNSKSCLRNVKSPDAIEKTEEDVKVIKGKPLSPSSIKTYLQCQAKFYYQVVKGLREDDDVQESLDNRSLGNVLHHTLEKLYDEKTVSVERIKSFLEDKAALRELVDGEIKAELKTPEVSGRDIVYRNLVLEYVEMILRRDIEYLESNGAEAFTMIGVEKKVYADVGEFKFKGIIDRLDSIRPGEMRVVDYKTGAVKDNDFGIDDGNAVKVATAVFGSDNQKRPSIALQLYLYDLALRQDKSYHGEKLLNSIYSPARFFVHPVQNDEWCEAFDKVMGDKLDNLLSEIGNTETPFARNGNERSDCMDCEFKILCKR